MAGDANLAAEAIGDGVYYGDGVAGSGRAVETFLVRGEGESHGHAADIGCESSGARFWILHHAMAIGFRRIGIARTFIHLDDDPAKPQEVVWLY